MEDEEALVVNPKGLVSIVADLKFWKIISCSASEIFFSLLAWPSNRHPLCIIIQRKSRGQCEGQAGTGKNLQLKLERGISF